MKYLYEHILGIFVFDSQFNLVEKVNSIQQAKKKYTDLKDLPEEKLTKVLVFFKDKKYFSELYNKNTEITKKKIKESVSNDQLISQTISNFDELTKITNMLSKRLREWYAWYLPEFSEEIKDHQKFVELILEKDKTELLKDIKVKESMGADLNKEDVEEMLLVAKEIVRLTKLKDKHEDYLERIMKKYCPNVLELAGVTIGAKLLELAKGLKRMALLPASTVQLLGAEKALFRHIKTNSPSPKHGIIFEHQLIQKTKRKDQGKAARSLADKLSLCARLDFFKGEFKAPEYKKGLEKKFL